MPFSHDTGRFNVLASLAAWLNEQLIANQPSSINAVKVVREYPEDPLTAPCWSITFLGTIEDVVSFQGGNLDSSLHGAMQTGIMEVNCWVTRKSTNWRKQLAQMEDAVTKAVHTLKATGSAVLVRDFYTDENAPTALSYRITIDRVEGAMPPFDPNPDIERRRLLIYYHYLERA